MTKNAQVNDVIQLDPNAESGRFGPLLCVVDEVYGWGVRCYTIEPPGVPASPPVRFCPLGKDGPGYALFRVKHGDYAVIGGAEWIPQSMFLVGRLL